MKIRAVGDNILVKRRDDIVMGQASIYNPSEIFHTVETIKSRRLCDTPLAIPDSWRAKPITGEVVSIGRGTLSAMGHLITHSVTPGSIIIFDHRAGSELKFDNETYLVMKESEILGVLN